jgi:hypothetical protein
MFDGLCILASLYLYTKVWNDDKSTAFTMLCFFVVSDVAYHYLFKEFRVNNNWAIYWIYNAINLGVMWNLKKSGAHLIALALISINVLLNIVVSFYFISNSIGYSVYNIYPYLAGIIMILCLLYMWGLGHGAKRVDSLNNRSGAVGALFRRCGRMGK